VFTQWLIQSFFPIGQHKPQVVALRKTTNAKPATSGMPVYRTMCGENRSGPVNNLKYNVYEVRNGSDIGIFSWMLGTFCGPRTRYFQWRAWRYHLYMTQESYWRKMRRL